MNLFHKFSVMAIALLFSVSALMADATLYTAVDFNDDTFGNWTTQSVASNADWSITTYSGVTYAYVNGYGADEASEDWLISPALDLSGAVDPALSFVSKVRYTGGSFSVLISTDYSGDVTTATWTDLNATLATGSSWTPSGSIDLTAYLQSGVYIAFKYTSDGTGSGEAPEWQVDDIMVQEVTNMMIQTTELFYDDFEGADLSPWIIYDASGDNGWQKYTYQGNGFARISGYGQNNEDWLISPAINLDGYTSPYFNFENAYNYSGDDLKVYVVEGYDGSSDPNGFTMTEVSYTISPGNYDFIGSGNIDLSSWEGQTVNIAFLYTSNTEAAKIWEVDNFGVYGTPSPVIISQYVETSSGTSPKGLEIWNISGYDIDLSQYNITILKGTNGGSLSPTYTVSDGMFAAGEVLVVGTADMGTYLADNTPDVLFYEYELYHNGDDAFALEMNGEIVDVFGMPGQDPGSAWTGDDVSTKDQNIQLIYNEPFTGDLDGWTDPSLRFEYVSDGLELKGFGLAPSNIKPKGPCDRDDLFISEYSEGGGNNKYIEIYNGTGYDVDLSDYQIWVIYNNGDWSEQTLGLSGTLANDEVYVIANPNADGAITGAADLTWGNATWNGNDAIGLAKKIDGTYTLIDQIGAPYAENIDYPEVNEYDVSGWFVGGIFQATSNFTIVRKMGTYSGNTDWTASAGTTLENSEWMVLGFEDWSNLGFHATDCNGLYEGPEKVYLINNNFDSGSFGDWSTYSVASNTDWEIGSYSGDSYAYMNGYGADEASDDWLISPVLDLTNYTDIMFSFENAKNYSGPDIEVLVSTDYEGGNPQEANWTQLTGYNISTGGWTWVNSGNINLNDYISANTRIAFRYTSTGSGSGDASGWEIDDVMLSVVIPTTYPNPFPLSMMDYNFSEWANNNAPGTYPDNMMFFLTEDTNPTMNSNFDKEYKLAYYFNGGATVEGEGNDGFAFRNGSRGARSTDITNYEGYLGTAVLPLNTTGRNNIRVTWTGKTINSGSGQYAIALQYRIGNTGDYTDFGMVYNVNDGEEGEMTFGPEELPDMLEDLPYVELRWIFYGEGAQEGNMPILAVDDIKITSESKDFVLNSPMNNGFVCNEADAPYVIEWYASNSYYINIDISTDFGNTYQRIFSEVPAGEEMIEWNIPREIYPNENIRVRISDYDNPSMISESYDVSISDQPIILSNSKSRVLCINETEVTLFVKAEGSNLSYQWLKDGVVINGATENVYTINDIDYDVSAFYTCLVSGDYWCAPALTDNIGIYVATETRVTREPNPVYVLSGETAWLEVEAHIMGVPPQFEPDFQWYQVIDGQVDIPLENEGKISGAHSSIMSITDVQEDYFNTSFYCEISTPCGDPVRTKVYRINEVNLDFVTQPVAVTTCMSGEIKLSVLAETSTEETIMYQWYKDNTPLIDNMYITGAETANLTISDADDDNEGTYYAVAYLENMPEVIIMSESVNVVVNAPPMITSEPDAVVNVEFSDEFTLSVTAIGDDLTYEWMHEVDGNYEVVGNEADYTVLVARNEDAGNYKCVVSNECGIDETLVIEVNVTTGGSVGVGEVIAGGFVLNTPKPNPVSSTTEISYYLPVNGNISLKLTDNNGNTVSVLESGLKLRGEHTLSLNVNDYNLSSGVYFFTLETDRESLTQKLIIVK